MRTLPGQILAAKSTALLHAVLDPVTSPVTAPALTVSSHANTPAVRANPSEECSRILEKRDALLSRVRGYREQELFHEAAFQNEFARQQLAFFRTAREDAVNELAQYDIANLTDECRARLTAFGVPFTEPLKMAAE